MRRVQPFRYDESMRLIGSLPVSDPRRKEAQRFVNRYLSEMVEQLRADSDPVDLLNTPV